jgi:transcriptional regulator with XRE-family HTH domain
MNQQQHARGIYIQALLKQSPLSRNQIASISGLSNPYILDLEKGSITNVGRDKLIALGIALDLGLQEIDDLLTRFDRTILSKDDIPLFINTTRRIRISAALHPVHDSFTFDLVLLSVEQRAGRHIIVSPRPASCLRAEGHRRYAEKRLSEDHSQYGDLVETIVKERKHHLLLNLSNHPVEQYVCRECLVDYVQRCQDPQERNWRIRHIRSAINLIETHDNFRFHLITECPSFIFVLKSPPEPEAGQDTLVIANIPPHRYQVKTSGLLAGFATENQAVIENFKKELQAIKLTVIEEFETRQRLVAFLEALASTATTSV